MRCRPPAVAILLVSLSAQAAVITWQLDTPGDAQGWTAREHRHWPQRPLTVVAVAAEDGLLRVGVSALSDLSGARDELISPPLHHRSELFDHVRIRFRVLASQPLPGTVGLTWMNSAVPADSSPLDGSACESGFCYMIYRDVTFTTEWQEVAFVGLDGPTVTGRDGLEQDIIWVGELTDIRLTFWSASEGPLQPLNGIEVDWITLTGVEEQLQGELPPPVSRAAAIGSRVLAEPAFHALDQPRVSGPNMARRAPGASGAVGDIDNDGDVDLVLPYAGVYSGSNLFAEPGGWVVVSSQDGGTRLTVTDRHQVEEQLNRSPYVTAADLDGDRRLEVLEFSTSEDRETARLLRNHPEDGWVVQDEFLGSPGPGLADVDGDGDTDLVLQTEVGTRSDVTAALFLYRNNGTGELGPPERVELPGVAHGAGMVLYFGGWVHHGPGGRQAGVYWYAAKPPNYHAVYWAADGTVIREVLPISASPMYAGDVDADGDVDVLVCRERSVWQSLSATAPVDRGMVALLRQEHGGYEEHEWFPDVELRTSIQPEPVRFIELNGDDVLDAVMVDHDERSPALLVALGRRGALPQLEGRYPFDGMGGTLLDGDMDGDGDTDVVMVGSRYGAEGVYVFENLSPSPAAVVETAPEAVPKGWRLDPNYPNPFNPQTWIPLTVPPAAGPMTLRVYDVLGRRIRTLIDARLPARRHQISWDGRDRSGQAVAAGVYFCRLRADGQQSVRKMVKAD